MSTHALDVSVTASAGANASRVLRAYAHCGRSSGVTLALISLSGDQTLSIDVKGLQSAQPSGQPRREYHLSGSASGVGGNISAHLESRVMYAAVSTGHSEPVSAATLDKPLLVAADKPVLLAPLTVAFVNVPYASTDVCRSTSATGLKSDDDVSSRPCAHVRNGVCEAFECGFNASDATSALQSAIDSDAHTVRISKVGAAAEWVVRPIVLRSHLTLVLADGVVLRAMRGQFHGESDSLLSAVRDKHGTDKTNITILGEGNATLAMWRADYANRSLYKKSEGRAALNVHGVSDLRIDNVQVSLSGGDGLYLADVYGAHISNVRSLWNYRESGNHLPHHLTTRSSDHCHQQAKA